MPKLRKQFAAIAAILLAACMTVPLALADMNGIDVSGWQSPTVTCTADYDFAVVKATQGTGFTNGYMTSQTRCVKQRGKSLGFYHYAGGGNATREADHFVNTVRPYVGEAVLVLDWESYQNAAWGNSNWIRVFVNQVHDRTGVWPLVYVSAAFIPQIPADVRANCGLWVAQYANNNPTGWQYRPWNYGKYGEAMRQYTSNGRINGYNGPLDLNYFRGTREQWDKYANPSKTQTLTDSGSAIRAERGLRGVGDRDYPWRLRQRRSPQGCVGCELRAGHAHRQPEAQRVRSIRARRFHPKRERDRAQW